MTDSLTVAESFKKKHGHVLEKIDKLLKDDESNRLNFRPVEYQVKAAHVVLVQFAAAMTGLYTKQIVVNAFAGNAMKSQWILSIFTNGVTAKKSKTFSRNTYQSNPALNRIQNQAYRKHGTIL